MEEEFPYLPAHLSTKSSKAYLANYLSNNRSNFDHAVDLCDDDIHTFGFNMTPLNTCHWNAFRRLICTRFIPLFDNEINVVFGVTTLCG